MAVDVINSNLPIEGSGTGPVTLNFAPEAYLSFPGGAGSPVPGLNLSSTTSQIFVTIGYINQWAAHPDNPLRGETVSFGANAPLQIVGGNIQLAPGSAQNQVLTWSGTAWGAAAPTGGPGGGIPEPVASATIFGRGGTPNPGWVPVVPVAGGLDLLTGSAGAQVGLLMRGHLGGWVLGPYQYMTDGSGNFLTDGAGNPIVVPSELQVGQAIVWAGDRWAAGSVVGGGAWGTITGTLSAQTDLQNALNAKFNINGPASQVAVSGADMVELGATTVQNALNRLFALIMERQPTEELIPVISSPTSAGAVEGETFSYTITATCGGGACTGGAAITAYNATNLPAGLTRSGAVISGSPSVGTAGLHSILLSATNAHGTGQGTLSLNVASEAGPPPARTGRGTFAMTGAELTELHQTRAIYGTSEEVSFDYLTIRGSAGASGTVTIYQQPGNVPIVDAIAIPSGEIVNVTPAQARVIPAGGRLEALVSGSGLTMMLWATGVTREIGTITIPPQGTPGAPVATLPGDFGIDFIKVLFASYQAQTRTFAYNWTVGAGTTYVTLWQAGVGPVGNTLGGTGSGSSGPAALQAGTVVLMVNGTSPPQGTITVT